MSKRHEDKGDERYTQRRLNTRRGLSGVVTRSIRVFALRLLRSSSSVLLSIIVVAQTPRQIDAPLLENQYLRVHLATLNDVNHFRSASDGAQVLYCGGSFVVLRDDGSFGRCAKGDVLFVPMGESLDFRSDGEPRPEMLIAEVKLPHGNDFVLHTDDAASVAPDVYHVLLDNDTVRVLRIGIAPGQRTKMHRHNGYDLRYPLTTATTRSTGPNGIWVDVNLQARVPRWTQPEVEHMLENVGTTESVAILIELK